MKSIKSSKILNPNIFYNFYDFFWTPNLIFKSIGYDFMGTTKSRMMRNFLFIVSLIIIIGHSYVVFNIVRQFFFFNFNDHIMDIVRLASCVAYSLNSNVKFFAFVVHRKLAHHIYDTLLEAYPKTEQMKKRYRVNSFFWSKLERSATIMYLIACWNVVFCPLILSFYIYNQGNIFPYLKCYPCEYPYNYRTPIRFLGVYLVEIVHSHYTVTVNWGSDLWLVCFTAQICMHLSYIAYELEAYKPEIANAKDDCAFLIKLINRHEEMLRLQKDLNTIFGISMAFNLISTTGVFCIVAIRLIIEGVGIEFFVFSVFLVNAVGQFYMVCYYGQKLTDAGINVGVAAYMQDWYNSSATYRKLLSILIIRSQKEAQLLAVGLQPISLETFKAFTGAAYRIFAILQSVLDLNF